MRRCAILLLLAAAATCSPIACKTLASVELCIAGDDDLSSTFAKCAAPNATDASTGILSLTAGLSGVQFLDVDAVEGSITCVDGAAHVTLLSGGMTVNVSDTLPLEITAIDLALTVTQTPAGPAIDWQGTLMEGEISLEEFTDFSIGFHVSRANASAGLSTDIFLEIDDLLGAELDLPSRISLKKHGLDFFKQAVKDSTSCPSLVGADKHLLAVPGVAAALNVKQAMFDVCLYLSDNATAGQPFLRFEADTKKPLSILGMKLEAVSADVTAAFNSTKAIKWGGMVSGSAELFGASASASAAFTESDLDALQVAVSVVKPQLNFTGSVSYSASGCSSQNNGAVFLSVPSAGELQAEGTLAQKDGCAANGKPLWIVTVPSAQALDVHGVSLTDVWAQLESSEVGQETKWSGEVRGTAQLGKTLTGTGTVLFSEDEGVTAFTVAGELQVGGLSGEVMLAARDGVLQGTGTVSFQDTTAAVQLSQLEANVTHVSTYNAGNAHLPVWDIQASMASLEIHGFALTDVLVALKGTFGTPDNAGDKPVIEWSGSVTGTGRLGAVSLLMTAEIEKNELTSLTGQLKVETDGVSFEGSVEVLPDVTGAGCASIAGDGNLLLVETKHTFEASLQYDECATATGAARYTVSGTATVFSYQGLELTTAALHLKGLVSDKPGKDLEWAGTVAATANLFGGSSGAKVSFADGSLQAVDVHTRFMTGNGALSGALEIGYVNSCTQPSSGSAAVAVRLAGADELKINADVLYYKCTGAMSLDTTVAVDWNGPGGHFDEVTVSLKAGGHGGAAMLSTRTWIGKVTARAGGLSVDIEFNSSANATSVEAVVSYEDDNMRLTTAVGNAANNCHGSGLLILKNLPHQVPAMELDVAYAAPCGQSTQWDVSGSLKNLEIPFMGKTLVLNEASVKVSSNATGHKAVELVGVFMDDFDMTLAFPVPVRSAEEVTLVGRVRQGRGISVDRFASTWQGSGSPFSASMAVAAPTMAQDMKNTALGSAVLEINFGKGVTLMAEGLLFGMQFDALLALQKKATATGSAWQYGVAFTASRASAPTGLPKVLSSALDAISPSWVRFSLARSEMTVGGVTLRRGLSLAAFMGVESGMMKKVLTAAPASLKERITEYIADGGLIVRADIVSASQVTIFVSLRGDVKLSDRVSLREVALAFIIESGPPQIGFMVTFDFTVGKGAHAKDLTAKGFMSLSLTGSLTLAAAIDSDEPWVNPFGVRGVAVLFPLGVKLTLSPPAMLPSAFALIGGTQIGGTSGSVAVGIDLQNFRNTAVMAEVTDFNFHRMLRELARCDQCLGKVGNVLTDMSMERFTGSFNPDPFNPVAIRITDVARTIPAGITVEVKNLDLWGVIKIDEASFRMINGEIEAVLRPAAIDWGVIQITGADGTSGPLFALTLRRDRQALEVHGRAVILGQSVTLMLEVSDSGVFGYFAISMGRALEAEVSLSVVGRPGSPDFRSFISASMKSDVIALVVDIATEFLHDLSKSALSALDRASSALQSAQKKLDDGIAKLDAAYAKAESKINGAQASVGKLQQKMNSKWNSCKSKESRCRRRWWTCGAVPICWIEYGAIKVAYKVAYGVLEGAKKLVQGIINGAKGVVYAAKGVVAAAERIVDSAKSVVKAFDTIVARVGGLLRNALRLHSLSFEAELSRDVKRLAIEVDMTVVGTRFQFGFDSGMGIKEIAGGVYSSFRGEMKKQWGHLIRNI
eukprot:TRINITY_DN121_c0_g1_i10.p2 TRINITY_DN121_c0_g1~~TRINITY_DN121_c0_g1_i10.p2  ORF type:complete len:1741 (+),score=802.60 TRINITY_DN121_c0_g1_i10:83-5224(+)